MQGNAALADSPLEQHRTGARCRRPTPPTPATPAAATSKPPYGAAVYLIGRIVDAAAARKPDTIGQTAVHAEDEAAAMPLMSHRLSPQGL